MVIAGKWECCGIVEQLQVMVDAVNSMALVVGYSFGIVKQLQVVEG